MSADRWNPEQRAAVERRGHVFVAAGAGTGKTAVLVERVLAQVLGGTPIDRLLAITFTDRAASELRRRVREGLELRGEMERARAIDTAWISTIHRFCLRILRANAFDAGLDPRFAVADEIGARLLRSEAFDIALERFLAQAPADDDGRRLDLLAAYGRRRLRETLSDVHEQLRSAGRPLELRPHAVGRPGRRPSRRRARRPRASTTSGRPGSRPCSPAARSGGALRPVRVQDPQHGGRGRSTTPPARRSRRPPSTRRPSPTSACSRSSCACSTPPTPSARTTAAWSTSPISSCARARSCVARPDLAAGYRERFACVLVDEFQDTNRLQCELIDLVAGGELFLVGDEFQSIYRFRHADVDVYRARRAQAGDGLIALRRNYRSRPHVIGTVNESYRREFPDRYEPLLAEGAFDGVAPGGGRVDLLLTDKVAYRQAGQSWRDVEARALAARIAELVDGGECRPGQVVMLFEAGTDAARYETALRERNLQTVRATGRGYYAQQQVSDVLAYLRLIRNRYDDVALLTVLASPLVGMSNDGLWRVRRAAIRRPIFTALERDEPPAGLAPEERRLVLAFGQRFARLVRASAEVSLERLCDLIAAEHDYDLACLAMPDGDRRFANLRKLGRLRGRLRGGARARPGGVRALLRRAGRAAGARGRGGDRRGGPRRDRAHDGARGQGARVRRGGAGRLRPRAGVAADARHPGRLRRAHRAARGRSRDGPPAPGARLPRGGRGRAPGRARGGAPAAVRRHDARPPPPDRERRARPRRGDDDRPPVRRARRRSRLRPRSSTSATPACACASSAPGRARPRAAERQPWISRGQAPRHASRRRAARAVRRGRPHRRGAAGARADRGRAAGAAAPAELQRPLALSPLRLPLLRPARARAAGAGARAAPRAAAWTRSSSATPSTSSSSGPTAAGATSTRTRARRTRSASAASSPPGRESPLRGAGGRADRRAQRGRLRLRRRRRAPARPLRRVRPLRRRDGADRRLQDQPAAASASPRT